MEDKDLQGQIFNTSNGLVVSQMGDKILDSSVQLVLGNYLFFLFRAVMENHDMGSPKINYAFLEDVLLMCLNGLSCSQNAGNWHSESTKFQIFLGEHGPKPP